MCACGIAEIRWFAYAQVRPVWNTWRDTFFTTIHLSTTTIYNCLSIACFVIYFSLYTSTLQVFGIQILRNWNKTQNWVLKLSIYFFTNTFAYHSLLVFVAISAAQRFVAFWFDSIFMLSRINAHLFQERTEQYFRLKSTCYKILNFIGICEE